MQSLMFYYCRIKVYGSKGKLHYWTGTERADYSTYPYGAAEKIPNKGCKAQKADAYSTYRYAV